MMTFTSPFDFVKNVSYTKEKIDFEENKQHYIPFLINRSLSYYLNTVLLANEMNINTYLDPKLQYDFYFNIVRKEKRFSKWHKRQNMEEIKTIGEKYRCNWRRAKEIFNILQRYK
jgi:hypothetical protein